MRAVVNGKDVDIIRASVTAPHKSVSTTPGSRPGAPHLAAAGWWRTHLPSSPAASRVERKSPPP